MIFLPLFLLLILPQAWAQPLDTKVDPKSLSGDKHLVAEQKPPETQMNHYLLEFTGIRQYSMLKKIKDKMKSLLPKGSFLHEAQINRTTIVLSLRTELEHQGVLQMITGLPIDPAYLSIIEASLERIKVKVQ